MTGVNWSAEDVRAHGYEVVDLVADYLGGLAARDVFRPVPEGLAREFAAEEVPVTGAPARDVLADFARRVAPYPLGNGHPRFHAWVNSPPHVLGVFAELLAATMNPSVAGGNHAAVQVEHQVIRWFTTLLGYGADAGGLLVSGGSMATLTALAVARHEAARRSGWDVRAEGVRPGLTIYLSDETHACARKAAELLGFGSAGVRTIPSVDGRLPADQVAALLDRDRADGATPVAVVASVGTVNTGAIDPIADLADVCAGRGVWLHVDGAYGGPAALFLPEFDDVREALARADSVALDPHKWMYTPVDAGLVLLRDAAQARDAFSLVPPYLRTDDDPHGVMGPPWFSEYGFEQTRPFRALKVWMQLHHLGTAGYEGLIRHDLEMAQRLAHGVRDHPELELLAHGLSTVCFRCRPAGIDADRLDELNRRVLTRVQLGGKAFLSGTVVDGVYALRACVVNPGTGPDDIDALLMEVSHRCAVR